MAEQNVDRFDQLDKTSVDRFLVRLFDDAVASLPEKASCFADLRASSTTS